MKEEWIDTALKGFGRPRDSSRAKKIADVSSAQSHALYQHCI